MFQTEHEFQLPKGYLDEDGNLHQTGVMRLATAADEILPLSDPRLEKNPGYLVIIILSRVVTKLGKVRQITPKTIEGLFTEDLAYLQVLFNEINGVTRGHVRGKCPRCGCEQLIETNALGELAATP